MIGTALAAFAAVAVLGQAEGRATPDRAEVQAALLAFLNADCGPSQECNHPYDIAVRRVRCMPEAGNRVRCRMQERVAHYYIRRPVWQPAEYGFVYDAAGDRWTVDCRPDTPSTAGPSVQIVRCN